MRAHLDLSLKDDLVQGVVDGHFDIGPSAIEWNKLWESINTRGYTKKTELGEGHTGLY